MGIKGLSAFLKAKCSSYAGKPFQKQEVRQKLAVDVSLFLHKFFYTVGPEGLGYAFGSLRSSIYSHNCEPIWVFDGNKLHLKDNERAKRAKARETRMITELQPHPSASDFAFIKDFLSSDYTRIAKYEAEALCCYLVQNNEAYAALTADTDVFAYLCPRVIHGASMTLNDAKLIETDKILEELQLTGTEFQQLCVYCGNDFIENLESVGPAKALRAIREKQVLGSPDYQNHANIILHLFQTYCYENE